MTELQRYHWPGNIRELENVLERAVINSSGPKLRLMDELKKSSSRMTDRSRTIETVEREYILSVLEQTEWKVSGKNGAAEILGLQPKHLARPTSETRTRKTLRIFDAAAVVKYDRWSCLA